MRGSFVVSAPSSRRGSTARHSELSWGAEGAGDAARAAAGKAFFDDGKEGDSARPDTSHTGKSVQIQEIHASSPEAGAASPTRPPSPLAFHRPASPFHRSSRPGAGASHSAPRSPLPTASPLSRPGSARRPASGARRRSAIRNDFRAEVIPLAETLAGLEALGVVLPTDQAPSLTALPHARPGNVERCTGWLQPHSAWHGPKPKASRNQVSRMMFEWSGEGLPPPPPSD